MRVKKDMFLRADGVVPGDVFVDCGFVHYTHYNVSLQKTEIVYLSDNVRGLLVARREPYAFVDIVREVEKPNELTIVGPMGSGLRIEDVDDDVQLTVIATDGSVAAYGRLFDPSELIDAIKQVKGLD